MRIISVWALKANGIVFYCLSSERVSHCDRCFNFPRPISLMILMHASITEFDTNWVSRDHYREIPASTAVVACKGRVNTADKTMRTHISLLLLVFALCELTNLATGNCLNYCDNKNTGYGTRPCTKTLTETGYFTRKCGFMWGKRCVTGYFTKYKSGYGCCQRTCPVDAGWGSWSSWSRYSSCSVTCGVGLERYKRKRSCNNPVAKNGGRSCSGQRYSDEYRNCYRSKCPINGGWSSWKPWQSASACSVTCGTGTKRFTSTRSCNNPKPQYGGRGCSGLTRKYETRRCSTNRGCPVDGGWGNWTRASASTPCSVTCGVGIQVYEKQRSCNRPTPKHGGKDCRGVATQKTKKTCSSNVACPEKGSIRCLARKCSEYGNCGCSFGFYGDGFTCTGSRGRQFLVLFMENAIDYYSKDRHFSKIHVASRKNATVTIKTSKSLSPKLKEKMNKSFQIQNGQTEMDVPIAMRTLDFKTEHKGIMLETSETVSLFAMSFDGYSSDSSLILPVERLGRRYIVGSSAPYSPDISDYNSQVAFVAAEDNTVVTVTFNIADGRVLVFNNKRYQTGHKMEFDMKQMEDFQISHNRDLTGTVIESSKPIAVFAGNKCNKLKRFGYCSHLVEQLPPTSNLDKTFIVAPSLKRTGGMVRVVANSKTYLQVIVNDTTKRATVEKTRHYDVAVNDNSVTVIKANAGVLVLSFAVRLGRRTAGDPYMTLIPGLEQYINQYYIAVPKEYNENFLTVIIPSEAKSSLRLNSKPVPSGSVVSEASVNVTAEAKYVTMVIEVAGGAHQVETTDGTRFGLLIHGRGRDDGYGYAANMVSPGII